MAETCPIRNMGHPVFEFPEVCQDTCAELWDTAITEGRSPAYDLYKKSDDDEMSHDCLGDIENSHEALMATGIHEREIVLVDQCIEHGEEIGEQGYFFECPLELEA